MQKVRASSRQVVCTIAAGIVLTSVIGLALRLPAAEVSLDQFMIERGYAVVPMKHGYVNRFYAEANLNGKPVRALVDTGASELILDRRKATRLKPAGTLREPTFTPFGKLAAELPMVNLERLELAGAVFTNYPAVVVDLHRDREVRTGSYIPTSTRSDQFDLILGMSFLAAAHAAIGCEGPALYLRQEPLTPAQVQNFEASLRASGYSWVSFITNALPYVQAQVNGKDVLLVIDIGATFTAFDGSQIAKFDLADHGTAGKLSDAAERKRDLRYTRANSIKLAGFDTGPMPVGVADFAELRNRSAKLQSQGWPLLLGFVGPEVLCRARALIDCGTGTVYVKSTPNTAK